MTQFDAIIDKIAFNMYESFRAFYKLRQFNFSRIEWICVNLWMYLGRIFNGAASARPSGFNRLHFDAQQLTTFDIKTLYAARAVDLVQMYTLYSSV